MPTMKEILTVLILRLLPAVVVFVLACRWTLNELAVPHPFSFWINFLGVVLIAKLIAGSLFVRMYRADRMSSK